MKLEINVHRLAEGLAMVLPCAGRDEMLPTLVAVAFHLRENGSLALVATNRYLLAEYVIAAEDVNGDRADLDVPATFIVPRDTAVEWAKLAKRAARTWQGPTTPVTFTVEGENATLADYNTSHAGRLFDGQHVNNYAKWLPTPSDDNPVTSVGFNPENLAAIAKVAAAAGKNLPVRFNFNGETNAKPVLFRVGGVDNFRGAVMPVRIVEE